MPAPTITCRTTTSLAATLLLSAPAWLPAASFLDLRLSGIMQAPITDGSWQDNRPNSAANFDLDSFDADDNFSPAVGLHCIYGRTVTPLVGFVIGGGVVFGEHNTEVDLGLGSSEFSYQGGGIQLTGGLLVLPTETWSIELRPWFTYGQGTLIPEDELDIDEEQLDAYSSYGIALGTYYAFSKPGLLVGAEIGYGSFEGDFEWDLLNSVNDEDTTGSLEGASFHAAVTLGVRF